MRSRPADSKHLGYQTAGSVKADGQSVTPVLTAHPNLLQSSSNPAAAPAQMLESFPLQLAGGPTRTPKNTTTALPPPIACPSQARLEASAPSSSVNAQKYPQRCVNDGPQRGKSGPRTGSEKAGFPSAFSAPFAHHKHREGLFVPSAPSSSGCTRGARCYPTMKVPSPFCRLQRCTAAQGFFLHDIGSFCVRVC